MPLSSPLALRAALLACLPALLSLGACSRTEAAAPRAQVQRTEPEPSSASGSSSGQAEELVERYEVTRDRAPWKLTRGQGEIHPVEGKKSVHAQRIQARGGARMLRLQGPFEPGSFDRLYIDHHCKGRVQGQTSVTILGSRGKQVVLSDQQRVKLGRGPGRISFELPGMHGLEERAGAILIDLPRGRDNDISIASIMLTRSPLLGGLLPEQGEAARLVTVGEEARMALGLTDQEPISVPLELGEGAQLQFGIGTPAGTAFAVGRGEVHVELLDGSNTVLEQSFPVTLTGRWTTCSMDLSGIERGNYDARFQLRKQAGVEGADRSMAVLLERPTILYPSARAPRVLLVTSDTHRADHVGLATQSRNVTTPFLDRLAERGAYFADCYASAQSTLPSHTSLMTGLAPLQTGVLSNSYNLGEEAVTLAERFADAGYLTYGAVSVTHLAADTSGLGQGFDRLAAPANGQRDSEITWSLLEGWLDETPEVPLFVWLHVFDAHGPYTPPEGFTEAYWDEERDPRSDELPELAPYQQATWDPSIRDVEYIEALYKAEVSYVDQRLEGALGHPRLAGALVAITADHGEILSSRSDREWFTHSTLIPDTLHIPLILHGPGVPTGFAPEEGVLQVDVGRTLLDLVGLGDVHFPGQNLVESPGYEVRYALGSHARTASIRIGRWFLAMRVLPRPTESLEDGFAHTLELFDLEADPGCMRDLEEAEPRVATSMRALLVEWLQNGAPERVLGSANTDNEDLAAELEALGYATDAADPAGEYWDPECPCGACAEYSDGPRASGGVRSGGTVLR